MYHRGLAKKNVLLGIELTTLTATETREGEKNNNNLSAISATISLALV